MIVTAQFSGKSDSRVQRSKQLLVKLLTRSAVNERPHGAFRPQERGSAGPCLLALTVLVALV